MAAFCALRAVLAAPLEALLGVDKLLFLLESGAASSAQLLCCFDAAVSPRSLVVIGRKSAVTDGSDGER